MGDGVSVTVAVVFGVVVGVIVAVFVGVMAGAGGRANAVQLTRLLVITPITNNAKTFGVGFDVIFIWTLYRF
jgi:hypothetical protein